ncbi:MAG TPA: MFS transporter [Steroidobacteraceae bacterium]|jgi:predicted MFS family arabinose efflux permease|nr:MFS transporter [Steroidobacteraceae bacterium]
MLERRDGRMVSRASLARIIGLNVAAIVTLDLLPTVVAGAQQSLHLSVRDVGVFSSIFMLGNMIGSLLSPYWTRRCSCPTAARVALLGMMAANGLCALIPARGAFLVLQGFSGLFGALLYSLTLTVISAGHGAHRNFGLAVAAQVAFQAIGLLMGPVLLARGGLALVLWTFVALSGLALGLTFRLPITASNPARPAHGVKLTRPPIMAAFAGCFLFYAAVTIYWTYVDPIARGAGFTSGEISHSLAIGVAAGFCGALTAAGCSRFNGRNVLLAIGAILTVASAALLLEPLSWPRLLLSSCFFNFTWNFTIATQYSAVTALDRSGRAIAQTPAFHTAGGAAGPALGALVIGAGQFSGALLLVAAAALLSLGCFLLASSLGRRVPVLCPPAEASKYQRDNCERQQ